MMHRQVGKSDLRAPLLKLLYADLYEELFEWLSRRHHDSAD
jgi:hypothetical protein